MVLEYHMPTVAPIIILRTDAATAKSMAEAPRMSWKLRHMRVRLHAVRQLVASEQIQCKLIKSGNNRADIYTKPVTKDLLDKLTLSIRRSERRALEDMTISDTEQMDNRNRPIRSGIG